MSTQTVSGLIQHLITNSLITGFILGRNVSTLSLLKTTLIPFKSNLLTVVNSSTVEQPSPVNVKKDSEKEYLDIDVEKMEIGKIYLIKYDNETQAVQRLNNDQVAFYDVVQ